MSLKLNILKNLTLLTVKLVITVLQVEMELKELSGVLKSKYKQSRIEEAMKELITLTLVII
jgi:hypothetical protein